MVARSVVEMPRLRSAPGEDVSVLNTTEVRWFFAGEMPAAVSSWFTNDGARGLADVRTDDYYLVDDDTGLKLRLGHTLELKSRRGAPQPLELIPGCCGFKELWTRWSPVQFLTMPHEPVWHPVDKVVVKRRFDTSGFEIPLTNANLNQHGADCDVEITSVSVNAATGWSMAFAASGPRSSQLSALRAAAKTVLLDDPRSFDLDLTLAHSAGYPEWLASVLTP